MQGKRVWISGAAGMMGSHLMEMLLADGNEVLGTYYKPTISLQEIEHMQIGEVDVTDWCSVYDSLKAFKPDVIFHLAAQSYPTVSWERPTETLNINVNGTVNIFEAVKRLALHPRIVVACSSAEYGIVDSKDIPVKEEHTLAPLHPYGVSKVAQDLLTYQYFENFGIAGIRARIFNCTGTRKVGDAVSDFVRRVVNIEAGKGNGVLRVGNLNTRRAITDVRDLNRALMLLAECGTAGAAYNVSGDTAYLMQDVVNSLCAKSSVPGISIEVDPSLLRPTDEKIIWGDTSRLKADTGWKQQISIDQTVADMLEYWRSKAGIA